ncbi:MAG TPA: biopolymer transporter ExbD [Thiotrichales bacterium]|nr:biopolymer transporter ExbD [Thiotrichales bacterium]
MKMSRRARRMERHHRRARRATGLNLVSLMDIFTILVFFLLVSSGDGEVLPTTRSVQLPESLAEQRPRQNLVVMVTDTDILLQGRKVLSVDAALQEKGLNLQPLLEALNRLEARRLRRATAEEQGRREVTIMGNRDIPYRLLKKVMATCTEAGFGRVSLAVLQKVSRKDDT